MADITMCLNEKCLLKECCKRYMAIPEQEQSFSDFDYLKDKSCLKDILEDNPGLENVFIRATYIHKYIHKGKINDIYTVNDFVLLEDNNYTWVDGVQYVGTKKENKFVRTLKRFQDRFLRVPPSINLSDERLKDYVKD